ncbi:MAG TPA: hypothetical protein VFD88_03345 [Clostridia bacterium]|nr:hypothetical protein [Clostridia bacterium]
MDATDRIEAYLDELERELEVPRRARRRISSEIREHLLDAAEAERPWATEESFAAERAILRFGFPAETASQFNRGMGRRYVLVRRRLVPSVAAFALTLLATATVLAFDPGPAPSSWQAPHLLVLRHSVAQPHGG